MGRTPKTSPPAGEVDGRRPAGEGRAATSRASPAALTRPAVQADLSRARRGEGGTGRILVAEFGRAHGLKGEVRLKSFTADPRAVASYGPLSTGDGRGLTLRSVRPAPGGAPDLLIAQVEGVTGREAAEALNRVRLFVDREKLAPPEDEDEFLLADLIGLAVLSPAGEPIGAVVGVPNYGGGDLLEIAPAKGGPSALLPFTKAFVPAVDIPGRRIVVDPPEDLFEPARPEPGDAG